MKPLDKFTLGDLRQLLLRAGAIPDSLALDDPGTSFDDLGLDSAVLLALQVEIEQGYDIVLRPEDLERFETVGGGVEVINAKLTQRAQGAGSGSGA